MRIAAFGLLAFLLAGCGEESGGQSFETLARAHAAGDVDVAGHWTCEGAYDVESCFLIERGSDEDYRVQFSWTYGEPQRTSARRVEGELILDDPLGNLPGVKHLFFCRFTGREVLIYEGGAWFTRGPHPAPLGSVFTRAPTGQGCLTMR